MAPFVEKEWGEVAYRLMRELKDLFDPTGLLNPGVIINPDPQSHLQNLKSLPKIESVVDRCIECGFCESACPSRRLTLTPRQRIVLRREIARQSSLPVNLETRDALEREFTYAGLDTCAVDGLCATTCPVNINTGDLVKHLRAQTVSEPGRKIALFLSRYFRTTEEIVKLGVHMGHLVEKIIGVNGIVRSTQVAEKFLRQQLPKWNTSVPHPTGHISSTSRVQADYIYFPSCLTRVMGRPPGDPHAESLIETLLTVSQRAGIALWMPEESAGHCCGMPFGSKGYEAAFQEMLHHTLTDFWEWSDQGHLPIVIDASSCAYTFRTCRDSLTQQDYTHWQQLTILDPIEFAHDVLLPRLEIHSLPIDVILHPNCASRKLGLQDKLLAIARSCVTSACIPLKLDCCGFAGDRGLLFPELTASATMLESEQVKAQEYDGFYSSNLTCEMGMAAATGKPYRSIFYLIEKASRTIKVGN
jgi:D-lactate dehydrogenase